MKNATTPHRRGFSGSPGFSTTELMIGMTVITLVATGVFSGITQMLIFTTQEEMNQELRNDLLLTMAEIRRDVHMATNVVPKAGARTTGGTTLCLRQPVFDGNEKLVDGVFKYVSYSVESSLWQSSQGELSGGILREEWDSVGATSATSTEVLNDSVLVTGFLYGGQSISDVPDLNKIREVEMIMVSGRETGLRIPEGETIESDDYWELWVLEEYLEYGIEFPQIRFLLDYINQYRVGLAVASSMGTATFRNQRVLGLTGEAPPTLGA